MNAQLLPLRERVECRRGSASGGDIVAKAMGLIYERVDCINNDGRGNLRARLSEE